MTTILKKISADSLTDRKGLKDRILATSGPVFVGRMVGTVTGVVCGVTQYSKYTGFSGTFRGVTDGGDILLATRCFIPGGYENLVLAEVGKIDMSADGKTGSVEKAVTFAFDVYATLSKGEVGYQYQLRPAGEFVDPMATYLAQLKPIPVEPIYSPLLDLANSEPAETAETPYLNQEPKTKKK